MIKIALRIVEVEVDVFTSPDGIDKADEFEGAVGWSQYPHMPLGRRMKVRCFWDGKKFCWEEIE